MRIGLHISIADSIDKAVKRAMTAGCNTFQIFTRNPRSWGFKPLDSNEVKRFREKVKKYKMKPVFDHMPYLSNLASSKPSIYRRSIKSLLAELKRCTELGIPYLVTHLGSHLGTGKNNGFNRIIDAINEVFSETGGDVLLLLENSAGTRNSMGSSFEDIKHIVDGIDQFKRVGICFDTCHAFAAGYDLRTKDAVSAVIERFNEVLGWESLRLVHLNDSKGGLRSRIDRHEHIGLGKIEEEGFRSILHTEFRKLPIILETPIDEMRSDIENLDKVRELAR